LVCPGCSADNRGHFNSTLTRAAEEIADIRTVINTTKAELDNMKMQTRFPLSLCPPLPPRHSALSAVPGGSYDEGKSDPGDAVMSRDKTLTDLTRLKKNVVISGF